MKYTKKISFIVIIAIICACSSNKKNIEDKNLDRLNDISTKLIMEKKISTDSSLSLIKIYLSLESDSAKQIFVNELEKQVNIPIIPEIKKSSVQSDFINNKVKSFKSQINSNTSSTQIKEEQTDITKEFLKTQNYQLTNWEGVIISNDMFKDKELDISITIHPRQIVGQKSISGRLIDCGISIEAIQATSKKNGYKGINRSGELYEKVKNLKKGDKVRFTAKINNAIDNTEKSGFNLSTLFFIELADIQTQ